MKRLLLLRSFALGIATCLVGVCLNAGPTIEKTAAGLRAVGITAGADAIWFGETIDSYALSRRLTRHVVATQDDDRDGVVTFDNPPVSGFFLMIVVDVSTGDYAVHQGHGVRAREIPLHGNKWRSGLAHLDLSADYLEILLVRPGEGAWATRAAEGSTGDGDRQSNGKFRLMVNDMRPLMEGSKRPAGGVRRGDVLVIVDPQTLDYVIRAAKD